MGMLKDYEVILVETRKNRILIVDLKEQEIKEYAYLFMYEESDQTNIYTFSETKYLCL